MLGTVQNLDSRLDRGLDSALNNGLKIWTRVSIARGQWSHAFLLISCKVLAFVGCRICYQSRTAQNLDSGLWTMDWTLDSKMDLLFRLEFDRQESKVTCILIRSIICRYSRICYQSLLTVLRLYQSHYLCSIQGISS